MAPSARKCPTGITRLYSGAMKTAISVPEATAHRIDASARRHGMTRSEFYRRAAERFADELDAEDTTARVNSAIAAAGQPSAETEVLRRGSGDVITQGVW